MAQLKIKNITLVDEVETKEAIKIINEYRAKYCWFYIIPICLMIVSFVIACLAGQYEESKFNVILFNLVIPEANFNIFLVTILITVIGCWVYSYLMKPYRKLLRIAISNDRIRHEEKIRHQERLRLNKTNPITYDVEDIENTIKKAPPKIKN